MNKLTRLLKHRWLDASDTRRAVPDDMAQRLSQRIAASEGRHSGEVRLCIEAALPLGDLWRIGPAAPLKTVVRERAIRWFARLGVWDTEQNNGVLIYLCLAERAIELVADRGVDRVVPADQWHGVVQQLAMALRAGQYEQGLAQSIDAVCAVLTRHFPLQPGQHNPNELPDAPALS